MKVYVVCLYDYGVEGAPPRKVFDTETAAEAYLKENHYSGFSEEFEVES